MTLWQLASLICTICPIFAHFESVRRGRLCDTPSVSHLKAPAFDNDGQIAIIEE